MAVAPSGPCPVTPTSETEFDQLLEVNKDFLTAVTFIAPWSESCNGTKDLTRELMQDPELKHVLFVELSAEEHPKVSQRYSIKSVPSVVLIRNKEVLEKFTGSDVRNYASRVATLSGDSNVGIPVRVIARTSIVIADDESGGSLEDKLKRLIHQSDVMIFMKGNPQQPRCGFSRQVIEILNESRVPYKTFDILSDEEVRQGLKEYSKWQTYPQVYIKGALVGGLDVLREMEAMGNLVDILTGKEPIN